MLMLIHFIIEILCWFINGFDANLVFQFNTKKNVDEITWWPYTIDSIKRRLLNLSLLLSFANTCYDFIRLSDTWETMHTWFVIWLKIQRFFSYFLNAILYGLVSSLIEQRIILLFSILSLTEVKIIFLRIYQNWWTHKQQTHTYIKCKQLET